MELGVRRFASSCALRHAYKSYSGDSPLVTLGIPRLSLRGFLTCTSWGSPRSFSLLRDLLAISFSLFFLFLIIELGMSAISLTCDQEVVPLDWLLNRPLSLIGSFGLLLNFHHSHKDSSTVVLSSCSPWILSLHTRRPFVIWSVTSCDVSRHGNVVAQIMPRSILCPSFP